MVKHTNLNEQINSANHVLKMHLVNKIYLKY